MGGRGDLSWVDEGMGCGWWTGGYSAGGEYVGGSTRKRRRGGLHPSNGTREPLSNRCRGGARSPRWLLRTLMSFSLASPPRQPTPGPLFLLFFHLRRRSLAPRPPRPPPSSSRLLFFVSSPPLSLSLSPSLLPPPFSQPFPSPSRHLVSLQHREAAMTRVNLPQTPDRYRRTSASLCAPPPLSSPYRRQPPHPRPPLTTPSPSSTGSHGQLDHHYRHRHPPRVPRDPSRPRATLPIPPKPSANAAVHVDANPRPMTRPPTGSRLFLPIFQPRAISRSKRAKPSKSFFLSPWKSWTHTWAFEIRPGSRLIARSKLHSFSPISLPCFLPQISQVSYRIPPGGRVQSWRRAIY